MKIVLASAALGASLAGCASGSGALTTTELGRVPADEAIGLTRNELERRLGLSPVAEPRIQSAAIETGGAETGDILVEVFGPNLAYLHRCEGGRRPGIAFRRGGMNWSPPPMVFRNDVLVEFKPTPRRNEDLSQPAILVSTCERRAYTQKDASEDVAAALVMAPVLLPVAAIGGAINAVMSNDINKPLANLALGAAPPGGVEAYLADLPRDVRLLTRSSGSAELGLHFVSPDTAEEAARTAAARVFIVDGVVSRLEGRNCVLTTTRTLRCSPGY